MEDLLDEIALSKPLYERMLYHLAEKKRRHFEGDKSDDAIYKAVENEFLHCAFAFSGVDPAEYQLDSESGNFQRTVIKIEATEIKFKKENEMESIKLPENIMARLQVLARERDVKKAEYDAKENLLAECLNVAAIFLDVPKDFVFDGSGFKAPKNETPDNV